MPLEYNNRSRYTSRKQEFIENVYRKRRLNPLQLIQERRAQFYQIRKEMLAKFWGKTIDEKTEESK